MGTKKKSEKSSRVPKNRAREAGEVMSLGVEVATRFRKKLDEIADRERRSRRVVVEQILEKHFLETGEWKENEKG